MLSIVNLIATADLHQTVDIAGLTEIAGFRYDQSIYHCAYFKDPDTIAKVSVFATGKMICIGAKSFDDAMHDLDRAGHVLSEMGLTRPVKVKPKIQNIVATAKLRSTVDLETLSMALPNIVYEPEQFPAAIYHAKELEGASILIFNNGKIVFAGLKRLELLEVARRVLAEISELFTSPTT